MAVSRGFGQFSRRMGVIAGKVGENSERVVKRAAIAADQVAVLGTPVDTGRARANWVAQVGSPHDGVVESTDKTGNDAIFAAVRAVEKFKLGAGSIFLTNNLPYIVRLDEGSSQQAPNGMSQQAFAAAVRVAKRERLLAGI